MSLQVGDPVLAVSEDRPGDLQPQLAIADRDHLHSLVGPGHEGRHADLGDRGDRRQDGTERQFKVRLEDIGQFPGHLEPQGIDPDVGRLALAEMRLHLRLEDLYLTQQPGDRVLGLGELRHEFLRQLRADFGVPLFRLQDQLVEPRMRVGSVRVEVVPTALQVAVVCIQQAPGKFALSIGVDELSDRLGGVLQGLGDPICLQQHLGGGGKQRPVRWMVGVTSDQNRDWWDVARSSRS